ncbi:hypothetical protein ACH5RR_004606 [Cinchona calisaya]|uniref:Growth-regulating factor n=1 Tax=Cinchona calisaya TaxID=153742 RepID=A0ABD3AY40_9GENT
MDFNLKQWREQQQHELDQEPTTAPCAKLPGLELDSISPPQHQQLQQTSAAAGGSPGALLLFVTEPTSISKLTNNLSAPHPAPTANTKYPIGGGRGEIGSSYFSLEQWQELELQALIFRYMLDGAVVPPQLLHHLLKKSLLSSSYHHHHPYYQLPLHHCPPHLQPALVLQSGGYWGRALMDPEPGRCRRTDGKKWRCSRDVVAGHKYCERHMHRGRNRSRKPVEIPTTTYNFTTPNADGANVCGGILKNNRSLMSESLGSSSGCGGTPHFAFSGPSSSIDLLHVSQRSSESKVESQNDVHGDNKSSGQILRHFFDDWPRPPQESKNARSNERPVTSNTNLSISISDDPTTSDFSLKLSSAVDGQDDTGADAGNLERESSLSNWGVTGSRGANQVVASMGGPLAEALRSSTSNSSPTSVLHQSQRYSLSETSFISI